MFCTIETRPNPTPSNNTRGPAPSAPAAPLYGANPSRMCSDFEAITTISAIAHGCDWLVGQLSR